MLPLFLAVALADPPSPEALAAICAGRAPCRPTSHQYAGTDVRGHDLQVVEILLDDAPDDEAHEPTYGGPCHSFEWHVVRYDTDGETVLGHRLLLEVCNDGYGASGVGEDHIEVRENRFLHDRMGGSSWRWSDGALEQLWPPRTLETWRGSWRSPMGHGSNSRWSWETLSGWRTDELLRCGDTESPDMLDVASVVLPQVPEQAGPGPCAATIDASDARGLRVYGPVNQCDSPPALAPPAPVCWWITTQSRASFSRISSAASGTMPSSVRL